MRTLISLVLAITLLLNTAAPLAAQGNGKPLPFNNTYGLLNMPKVDHATVFFKDQTKLNIMEKMYLEANGIKVGKTIFMDKYTKTLANFRHDTEFYNYTPYQVFEGMKSTARDIAKKMQDNPRYKKALRKQSIITNCGMALSMVAYVALVVVCAPAAFAYGGPLTTTWVTGVTVTGVIATASFSRSISALVMFELFTLLGASFVDDLYSNLTNRLIKYNTINNQLLGSEVLRQSAAGSIQESIKQGNTCMPQDSAKPFEVKPSAKWVNDVFHKEALVRYTALLAIREYLYNEEGTAKYDLALLDIISLFTEAQAVEFDESVFTVQQIENGEIKTIPNKNIVTVGTSRLLERTPELIKALDAIQKM